MGVNADLGSISSRRLAQWEAHLLGFGRLPKRRARVRRALCVHEMVRARDVPSNGSRGEPASRSLAGDIPLEPHLADGEEAPVIAVDECERTPQLIRSKRPSSTSNNVYVQPKAIVTRIKVSASTALAGMTIQRRRS